MFGSHSNPFARNIQSCSVAPSSEVATLPAAAASTPGPSFPRLPARSPLFPFPSPSICRGVWLTSPSPPPPTAVFFFGLFQGGRQTSFRVSVQPASVARLTITSREKHAAGKSLILKLLFLRVTNNLQSLRGRSTESVKSGLYS